MRLWEFLKENPILLLLLFSWLVSMLGGAMQRAARKSQDQRRKQSPGRTAMPSTPTARAGDQGQRMAPEEIARQIRRAMGLETVSDAEPQARTVRAPEPPPPPVQIVTERRKGLRQELAGREEREQAAAQRKQAAAQHKPQLGAGVRSRTLDHLEPHIKTTRRARAHRHAERAVDLRRPATAIVAMEVLGTPVGLRDLQLHPYRAR